MASYDLTTIMDALQAYQRSESRQPNNRAVKQYLLNKGVSEPIAQSNSMNELCYWTEKELDEVFGNLAVAHGAPLGHLVSFAIRQSQIAHATDFVKPTFDKVQESVDKMGALCVNRSGKFCTNPAGGFVALSHVWSQGLGGDDDNRGLHRDLLHQVFDKVEPLGIKWVWTDSLAIPGGKRALNFLEEELKGKLINAMANIYREARMVLVFDALCLQLNSTNPVQVAIILSLGNWLTRMWTYQEIKLAKMAVVLTKKGPISFSAICRYLKDKAVAEFPQEWEGDARGKYPSIAKTFLRLQRNDEVGVSLPDVAIGCGYREAWDKLDYARAIYPTLNIEWRPHYSTTQAMRKMYSTQQRHASRLILFHGPLRASFPGWAPAVFNGLKDCKIIEPGVWKLRGLQRAWLTTKVKFIYEREADRFYLALESDHVAQCQSVAVISQQTVRDASESITLFEKAVRKGNGYLLTDERLDANDQRRFSIVGLLVEKFTLADSQEAWVCLTVAVGQTEKYYKAERSEWLLLHENPTSRDPMNGKGASELNYRLLHTVRPSPTRDFAEYPLHLAAHKDDGEWCRALLAVIDCNATDPRGWTPLQVAAASGSCKAAAVLIEAGAEIDTFNMSGNSALILAVDNIHVEMVLLLCGAGAGLNACSEEEGFGSALVTAVRRNNLELVSLLVAFGADATGVDAAGWSPLVAAVIGDDNDELILDTLLEAGADPNIPSHGLLPLSLAAQKGHASSVVKLLRNEADLQKKALPDLDLGHGNSPLHHAINSGSLSTVCALLEAGARTNDEYRDGWTPMMIAAKEGDHEIGKALKVNGASLDKSGADGLTPLHVAAMSGSRVFYKWLITAGVNPGVPDNRGRTAKEVVNDFQL